MAFNTVSIALLVHRPVCGATTHQSRSCEATGVVAAVAGSSKCQKFGDGECLFFPFSILCCLNLIIGIVEVAVSSVVVSKGQIRRVMTWLNLLQCHGVYIRPCKVPFVQLPKARLVLVPGDAWHKRPEQAIAVDTRRVESNGCQDYCVGDFRRAGDGEMRDVRSVRESHQGKFRRSANASRILPLSNNGGKLAKNSDAVAELRLIPREPTQALVNLYVRS